MFEILGYNFCQDSDALNATPTSLDNMTNTQLTNGIFDNLWMTRDVSQEYPTTIPTVWDYLTIMNADFNGDLLAGNIDFIGSQITKVRIKRRVAGTFDWMILYEIPVNDVEGLSFAVPDNLNAYGVEYEYAFVPMIDDSELNYITNKIYSEFNGIFICDMNTIFKYFANVSYSGFVRNNRATVFEPLGSKYPVVVTNALVNYTSGTVDGTIIMDDDLFNSAIDKVAEVKYRNELLDFLVNKKAKVLKDDNGGIWLMIVTGSPSVEYNNNLHMKLANVSFSFAEIGDASNTEDLYNAGMITLTEGGL